MLSEDYKKYIPAVVVLILLYFAYLTIKPLLGAIAWAAILAYIFYPFYLRINKKIRNEKISASLVTFTIILASMIVVFILVNILSREIYSTYVSVQQRFTEAGIEESCIRSDLLCETFSFFKRFEISPNVYIENSLRNLSSKLVELTSSFAISLATKIVDLFTIFFVMYYLLIDGKYLVEKLQGLLPLQKNQHAIILQHIRDVTSGVIYGHVFTAFLVALAASLGFYMFGIKSPVLLGILTGLASFIPAISTLVVWIPVGIFQILNGFSLSDNWLIARGVGVLIFGFIVLAGIDNIVKTRIISQKVKAHPGIVLVGAFGGLFAFGILGVVIGPLVATLIITLMNLHSEKKETD